MGISTTFFHLHLHMKSLFPKRLRDHIFQNGFFLLKNEEIGHAHVSVQKFSFKSLSIPVKSVSECCVYFQNALYPRSV